MNKLIQKSIAISLITVSYSTVAAAAAVGTVPEPGALSLLGIGAAAGLLVWAKNRKNKK